MPCQHTEIGVVVQNGRIGANGNRTDETIYQPANSLPFPADRCDTERPHPHSPTALWEERSHARATGAGSSDAVRHAPRRVLPSELHRRSRSRFRVAPRRDCRSGSRCLEETRPTRTYRSESRRTTGPHLAEVAIPTGPPKLASFINAEGLGRKGSKRKVDRLAFCRQTITAHDRRARLIVDIHVSA